MCIRDRALTAEEAANAPEGMKTLDLTGMKEYKFTMSVSALDCTGCGSCVNVCPGKKGAKALAMENLEASADEQKYFDYTVKLPVKEDVIAKFKEATVKGSQFKQPLLEFSGACAGCGETPYAKLITQLFGDRMYIANATGCSSIWGNSSPSTPYTCLLYTSSADRGYKFDRWYYGRGFPCTAWKSGRYSLWTGNECGICSSGYVDSVCYQQTGF